MNPRVLYEPNSQDTSRYTIPPLSRFDIQLTGDRTNGQNFPQVEGEFLYVERCDKPCLISLVNAGSDQTRFVREGDTITGPFKGLNLFHDNYANVSDYSVLTLLTSKSAVTENSLIYPGTKRDLAYNVALVNGVSATRTRSVPITPGARFWRVARVLDDFAVAAGFVGSANMLLQYRDINNGLIAINAITHNGVVYNMSGGTGNDGDCRTFPPVLSPDAALRYLTEFDFSGDPIPSAAVSADFVLRTGALNNVTMNPAGNEGTGSQRAYFVLG